MFGPVALAFPIHDSRSKLVGKWHLGHQPHFLPLNHGFQVQLYIYIFFSINCIFKEWFGAPNCHFKYNISNRPGPNIPVYKDDRMVGRYYEQFPIDTRTGSSNYTMELLEHVLEYISREDDKTPYFLYFAPDSTHAPTYSSNVFRIRMRNKFDFKGKKFSNKSQRGTSFGDALVEIDWAVGQILEYITQKRRLEILK